MSGQAATAGPGPPVRLLVADGDPSLRRVLHLALQARGYQVTLADTANAWEPKPDASFARLHPRGDEEPLDSQALLLEEGF